VTNWPRRCSIGSLTQGSLCFYIILDAECRCNVSYELLMGGKLPRWRAAESARFVAISQVRFQFFFPLFLFSHDFPADSTDAGFETQSGNDLLEQHILPASAGQNGLYLNFVGVLNVVTL
jgi:hypothetical protein